MAKADKGRDKPIYFFICGAQRSERRILLVVVGKTIIFFVGWTTLFSVSHSNEYQHRRTLADIGAML
jgi:hypothetical protein